MLDKRSIALLNAIIKVCCDSAYKIFSFEELASLMPKGLSLEADGLKESLQSLSNHEFISVKYQDDSEVCLRPLIKGRIAIENITEKQQLDLSNKKKLVCICFLSALFGGFVSGLMLYLIKLLGGSNAF